MVRESKTTFRDRSIDLLPFIVAEREHLVLKPTSDYGGTNVFLGWQCSDDEWKSALKKALEAPFVVQDRVPTYRETFPMLKGDELTFEPCTLDFNPYIWNMTNRVEGVLVRVANSDLLNITAGAGSLVPTFLVKPT